MAMAMEPDPNLESLRIASADELERKLAPAGYYPQQLSGPVVYDDEVLDLPPDLPWRRYFAGGSNRPHWIRTDSDGNAHFVECTGWGGSYEVYGPEYGEHYANAYDAFWRAEMETQLQP